MKKVEIDGRWFLQDRTSCLACGKRFNYTLPPEALFYWSRLCAKCDPTQPKRRLGFGVAMIEPMPMRMPWD